MHEHWFGACLNGPSINRKIFTAVVEWVFHLLALKLEIQTELRRTVRFRSSVESRASVQAG